MANFVITYDLNGPRPSHKEMDEHLRKVTTRPHGYSRASGGFPMPVRQSSFATG